MWGLREKMAIYKARREASEETNPAYTLVLDFHPPEIRKNTLLLLKPLVCIILCCGGPINSYRFWLGNRLYFLTWGGATITLQITCSIERHENLGLFLPLFIRDGCEELSSSTWQRESDGLEIRKLGSTPNSTFTGPWFPYLCCEGAGSALAMFSHSSDS